MDSLEVFFLLCGQVGIKQNTAQPDNAIKRRTQLVADGGDKGSLVAAGALQGILVALTLGDIAAKAHQAVAFPHAVIVGHLTDLKTGFASVRVIQPLFIGQRDVMAEYFFVRLHDLGRRLFRVNVLRLQVNQLLLAFPGEQLHRPVTAGKLFIFITVKHQIRRSIEERPQERGLLLKLDLRDLALFHFDFQLLQRGLTLGFRLLTI